MIRKLYDTFPLEPKGGGIEPKTLDDGQEGKGLDVELESIEKFVYPWLESKGFVKVSEHRWQNGLTEIVVTDYGYNVQFMHDDNEMAETSLRGHSIYQLSGYLLFNNLIEALPVADGEGEKVGLKEALEEIYKLKPSANHGWDIVRIREIALKAFLKEKYQFPSKGPQGKE